MSMKASTSVEALLCFPPVKIASAVLFGQPAFTTCTYIHVLGDAQNSVIEKEVIQNRAM